MRQPLPWTIRMIGGRYQVDDAKGQCVMSDARVIVEVMSRQHLRAEPPPMPVGLTPWRVEELHPEGYIDSVRMLYVRFDQGRRAVVHDGTVYGERRAPDDADRRNALLASLAPELLALAIQVLRVLPAYASDPAVDVLLDTAAGLVLRSKVEGPAS